ncbi:glucose dehydrogenase [FAD, quinone]-like [Diorhabda sublineata]|uniref:glucose dehydrogenase [FAD, quinone]-like n=1 Tax=Diorhabda sublineata TaxID=1163346 RepID=UPI0024E13978|nr:glucose dehydrogenase [FAD, quinone]-like [Diorhabda sublineata]
MKLFFLMSLIIFLVPRSKSNLIDNIWRSVQGSAMMHMSNVANELIRLYEKFIIKVDEEIWTLTDTPAEEYDFIVVGGGSAGSVVAARLSEIADWKICLLEAGVPETEYVDVPLLAVTFQGSIYDWSYTMEPQQNALWGLVDGRMPCPRGKALGGSSVLNFMIYSRGAKEDFDKWEELGNKGWSYKDVLPYFLKSEGAHNLGKADMDYHNTTGPLSVENTYRSSIVDAAIEGGAEIGLEYVDYNSPRSEIGVSPSQSTTRNGRRFSTGRAFLVPASSRSNLDIVIKALVTKIIINEETKQAQGVIYEKDGKTSVVLARKEVILCAGAINSPQLLMLSGIGPEHHLQKFGIPVIKDLPVGQGMLDHVCFYGTIFPVYFDWDQTWISYLTSLPKFVTKGEGPFATMGGVEGLGFIRTNVSSYSPNSPDVEFLLLRGYLGTDHGTFLRQAFRITDELYSYTYEPLENEPVWTIAPILLHPMSVGEVQLRSADPHDKPLIYGNYYSDKCNRDIKRMIEAIRYIEKFLDTKAFRSNGAKLSPYPVYGCQNIEFNSDEYWECALRTISVTLYHPMGTCKMGPTIDKTAVVDNKLRVRGIKGLRVADVSVIPFLSGHTNAAAIMIGERVSDFIKKFYNKL